MNKKTWEIINQIICLILIVSGGYHGIIKEEYSRGCFDLLLALLISVQQNRKND